MNTITNKESFLNTTSNKENLSRKINEMLNEHPRRKELISLTPKLNKNVSEVRLKRVEALTPKSNNANSINNRLKHVLAFNQPRP